MLQAAKRAHANSRSEHRFKNFEAAGLATPACAGTKRRGTPAQVGGVIIGGVTSSSECTRESEKKVKRGFLVVPRVLETE